LRVLPDGEVDLAGFQVQSFAVPHDSPGGCFGYSICSWEEGALKKVTVTTDIANPTDSAAQCIANSDIVVIESNHDVDMLENSRRPLWLKRRIREFGHLSNDQCAGMLLSVLGNSTKLPRAVMLAHVSQECNTNQLALETTNEALDGEGIRGIDVAATYPHRAGEVVCV
jgi:phosphoribosyl 1,2-cyclic phosphodiesterase